MRTHYTTIGKKLLIAFSFVLLSAFTNSTTLPPPTGHYVYGLSTAEESSTHNYSLYSSFTNTFPTEIFYYTWTAINGTINGTSQASGLDTISVTFGTGTSATVAVTFEDDLFNMFSSLKGVTLTTASGPAMPPMPEIINHPGYTLLTNISTPPSGEVRYWQSTSNGTSKLNSASSVTMTSGTVYYLRSYRSFPSEWSAARVINYTIDPASGGSTGLSDENYIHTIAPRIATTSVSSLANDEKIETINYFDGLGRSIQNVAIRAGGQSQDIITHMEYDNLGRSNKSYLPYASSSNTGNYRTDALTATNSFYDKTKYENTTNPYSETLFDGSPLNLPIENAAPGNPWKEGITTEHTIKSEYKLVATSDNVRQYGVSYSGGNPSLVDRGLFVIDENAQIFSPPTLYKFISKNENWVSADGNNNTVQTFKDYRGRVILNKTFESSVAHDTYYVYDYYGNLVYVLPPKAEPSSKPDSTELSELCFQYKYDDKNRLIEKKIPGKGWEYIVYNKLDQPILTQDTNLDAQGKWFFTKYDKFGRVAYTGITNDASSRSALQITLDGVSSTYVTKSTSDIELGGLTKLYYNNGAYPISISEIHTVNYYDNYTFDKDGLSLPSSYEGQTIVNYNDANKLLTNGLATGSVVRVLTSPVEWITTITGYDVKGRTVYVTSKNQYLNTTDIIKSKLDFVGAVDKTETSHTKGSTVTTEDLFTYDHLGRLKKQTQELNNTNVLEVIAEHTYDELGQLTGKDVGGKTTQGRLQNIDYTYNVRGWLKTINNTASLGNDLFGFKINFNTVDHSGTELYNGNISETEWKTSNDNVLRWYKYEYDDLSRITSATDNLSRYNLSGIQYDKNGNITNLTRKGHIVANPVSTNSSHFNNMDVLTYTYQTKSNKLLIVSDTANDTYGFKDDHIGSGTDTTTDYTYDVNGNMLTDTNKGVSSNITYNHLNLPIQVTLSGGNISYIYDALGIKLSKTAGSTTTYYAGNYVYEGSSLKFFNHPEGYVEPNGSNWDYIYQYKDHLGNIRLSYKDVNRNNASAISLQIQEENNYYPFGLKHKGYNNSPIGPDHKYGFGGKEEQDDNIGGVQLNWLDFSARNYDAALGRFMNIDPLADSKLQFDKSPYAYTWNNPVSLTDMTGMHPDQAEEYEEDNFGRVTIQGGGISFNGSSFSTGSRGTAKEKDGDKKKTSAGPGDGDCCNGAGDNGQSITEGITLNEVLVIAKSSKVSFKGGVSLSTDLPFVNKKIASIGSEGIEGLGDTTIGFKNVSLGFGLKENSSSFKIKIGPFFIKETRNYDSPYNFGEYGIDIGESINLPFHKINFNFTLSRISRVKKFSLDEFMSNASRPGHFFKNHQEIKIYEQNIKLSKFATQFQFIQK